MYYVVLVLEIVWWFMWAGLYVITWPLKWWNQTALNNTLWWEDYIKDTHFRN